MSYRLPDSLTALNRIVRKYSLQFSTERQAAFLLQQLVGTQLKFPVKGQSCFPVLQKMEASFARNAGMGIKDDSSGIRSVKLGAQIAKPATSKPRRGKGSGPKSPRIPATSATAFETGVVIFCDGACEPNPGAGGWGFVVYRDGVEIHSECGGDPASTNNIMEMTGALMALRWMAAAGETISGSTSPRLLCDSQYVVKGCNEWRYGWKAKGWKRGPNAILANAALWQELDAALTATPITLEWVKGHAGTKGNERADELAEVGRSEIVVGDVTNPDNGLRAAIEQQLNYQVV